MDWGKAQVIAALPEIIQNGVYLQQGKTTDSGHKRHIFASKVNVGTEKYVVGFVVEEDRNGKRFYNHELTEIENLGNPSLAHSPYSKGLPEVDRDSVLNIVLIILASSRYLNEARKNKAEAKSADNNDMNGME